MLYIKNNVGGNNGKPEQEKTVTASTKSIEVIPDEGKTLSKITINPTPSEVCTPSNSLIGKGVTIVPSSGYLFKEVKLNKDSDLIPENIKEGINIFGVVGTMKKQNYVVIDGIEYYVDLNLISNTTYPNISVSTLPYNYYDGSAVVYNNEIHILGGSGDKTNHYKWDGTSWTSVSTLPYAFYRGSAVVYNNEIHILGSYGDKTNHYKWDGTSWTSVSTLPYNYYDGSAVVYNNEIHILGGSGDKTNHYKWDGTSWTSVSTLPYAFYRGSALIYNNEIHIVGTGDNIYYYNHYKWDGISWTSVSTLPYNYYDGSAVVYGPKIHILGGSGEKTGHYELTAGEEWNSISELPFEFYKGDAIVYNNEIHILNYMDHYSIQSTKYLPN